MLYVWHLNKEKKPVSYSYICDFIIHLTNICFRFYYDSSVHVLPSALFASFLRAGYEMKYEKETFYKI